MIKLNLTTLIITLLPVVSSMTFAETVSSADSAAHNTIIVKTSLEEKVDEASREDRDSPSLGNREEDPYLVFYGNYCGIGNKSPDYSKPGIDLLDDLCKIHDFCYETFGHGACNCDMELINNLNTYQRELPQSPQAKIIISTMRMLFGKNTCHNHDQTHI